MHPLPPRHKLPEQPPCKLRPLGASLALALLSGPAPAQIVADPLAPAPQRPTVLATPAGQPLVQIQTPSAAGVSRNRYRQFDVSPAGAILNNSRAPALTALGGWVAANPWLAAGSARVIVNEVHSAAPSQLAGYLEIAGQRAELVIANPAGIQVRGGGFINASAATLSTGAAQFGADGSLQGMRVQQGRITIEGLGLDARSTDYTAVLARAIEVNAGLWAQRLTLVSGANQIDAGAPGAGLAQVAALPAPAQDRPALALDVGALGGMYAGAITLVGTEAGVGVRNAGALSASAGAGTLVLSSSGALSNLGTLGADTLVQLGAQRIDNHAGAAIASGGDTRIAAADALTNHGLIDAAGASAIDAHTVHNSAGGRLYGGHVSVAADALHNSAGRAEGAEGAASGALQASTVGARTRLDLGVRLLDNSGGSLLTSLGDMAIAGSLDGARHASTAPAQQLRNHGAAIDAARELRLAAQQVDNHNAGLLLQRVEVSSSARPDMLQVPGRQPEDAALYQHSYGPQGTIRLADPGSGSTAPLGAWRQFVELTGVQEAVSEDRVVQSLPARISAGGALSVRASLSNLDSALLAGTELDVTGGALVHHSTSGERIATLTGLARSRYWAHDGGMFGSGRQEIRDASGSSPFTSSASTRIALPTSVPHGGAPTGSALLPGAGAPDASLYQINADNPLSPLVHTDPRLSGARPWLSSDYLLQALALDPAGMHKRLGDGYYEQQLIARQLQEALGQRFAGDHLSDEAQYRALMDAGATFARAHALTPGVQLSAAQVAELTSDIVWLEARRITLENGQSQSVLAPRLYLGARPEALTPQGALLSGQNLRLDLDAALASSGQLAARQSLSASAQDIALHAGQVQAGQVSLAAGRDLTLEGASVQAASALHLQAGRDLRLASTTRSDHGGSAANGWAHTGVDRVARLYVSGDVGGHAEGAVLLASAGRDLTLEGALVANDSAQGQSLLQAGRTLTLSSVATGAEQRITMNAGNQLRWGSTQELGTRVDSAGALALASGGDTLLRGAAVHAGAGLGASAGANMTIDAASASRSLEDAYHYGGGSFLGKSRTSGSDSVHEQQALSSRLTGQSVTLQAGQDLTVRGSSVQAVDSAHLAAGQDLVLEAAAEQRSARHTHQTQQSGLTWSLQQGLNWAASRQSSQASSTRTTALASDVGAAKVELHAARDALLRGSMAVADQDLALLAGRDVRLEAGAGSHHETQSHESQSRSVQLIGGIAPRQTLLASNRLAQQASADTGAPRASILSANAGNLTIAAGLHTPGALHSEGAELLAAGDMHLQAPRIALLASQAHSAFDSHTRSKSLSVGAALAGSVGGLITSAYDSARAASQGSGSTRLDAARALKAGYDAWGAYQGLSQGM